MEHQQGKEKKREVVLVCLRDSETYQPVIVTRKSTIGRLFFGDIWGYLNIYLLSDIKELLFC